MGKVIYIAGKMSGKADYGRTDFNAAEAYLSWKGWTVLNPACLPIGLKDDAYMPICLAMVNAADAVCWLEDGLQSIGAVLEVDYAKYQGKTIYHGLESVPEVKGDEMRCKYLSDDFSAVCTHDGCPAVADFCPCVNYPEICKYAEEGESDERNNDGAEQSV